jgi:hypothetical protein
MVKMLFLLTVFRFACSDMPKNKPPFGRPQGAKNTLGKPAMPGLNPTQKVIGKLPAPHPDGDLQGRRVAGARHSKQRLDQRKAPAPASDVEKRDLLHAGLISLISNRHRPVICRGL